MTIETAQQYFSELSLKADIFANAVSADAPLMYTLNCVNVTCDKNEGLTITAPADRQKCFTDLNAAFAAFTSMVKDIAQGGGDCEFSPGVMPGAFTSEYLFDLPQDKLQDAAAGLTAEEAGAYGGAKGLCCCEITLPPAEARAAVNLTVSFLHSRDGEEKLSCCVSGLMDMLK